MPTTHVVGGEQFNLNGNANDRWPRLAGHLVACVADDCDILTPYFVCAMHAPVIQCVALHDYTECYQTMRILLNVNKWLTGTDNWRQRVQSVLNVLDYVVLNRDYLVPVELIAKAKYLAFRQELGEDFATRYAYFDDLREFVPDVTPYSVFDLYRR